MVMSHLMSDTERANLKDIQAFRTITERQCFDQHHGVLTISIHVTPLREGGSKVMFDAKFIIRTTCKVYNLILLDESVRKLGGMLKNDASRISERLGDQIVITPLRKECVVSFIGEESNADFPTITIVLTEEYDEDAADRDADFQRQLARKKKLTETIDAQKARISKLSKQLENVHLKMDVKLARGCGVMSLFAIRSARDATRDALAAGNPPIARLNAIVVNLKRALKNSNIRYDKLDCAYRDLLAIKAPELSAVIEPCAKRAKTD